MNKKKILMPVLALIVMVIMAGCGEASSSDGAASELQSLSVNPASLTMNVGDSAALELLYSPADAGSSQVNWVSSNGSVAEVDTKGNVTAVGKGKCTITVSSTENSKIFCDVAIVVNDEAIETSESSGDYVTMYVVNCHTSITLRTDDYPGAPEIMQIPFGSAVSFVSNAENGFCKVVYNSHTGYALSSYLGYERQSTPAPANYENSSEGTYDTMYVVNCKQSITLRKSDSTSAGEICQIPLGSAVSYIGKADNGFYKIIYNGRTGYALASYLSY